MTHTKGPWFVDGTPGYEALEIHAEGRRIAKALYHGGSEDNETDANARLMAAAPDLLTLAERVKDIATRACAGGFTEWDDYMDAKALELEAIATIARDREGETE